MAIISFTKVDAPYGWLGNMAPFPVIYNGEKWLTIEALFQALRFEDANIRNEIREEKSPMGAKMKAKKYKSMYAIEPMSILDIENMRACLRLKFNQHESLKQKLLKTGEHEIIENIEGRNGERHFFWGAKKIDNTWKGKNTMGKLLMELREELKNNMGDKSASKT